MGQSTKKDTGFSHTLLSLIDAIDRNLSLIALSISASFLFIAGLRNYAFANQDELSTQLTGIQEFLMAIFVLLLLIIKRQR